MTTAATPAPRLPRAARSADGAAPRRILALIGRDVRGPVQRAPRDRRWIHAALVGSALALLLLAGLRVQLTQLRYRLAEVTREEQALDETRRELIVAARQLRDPKRLAELAARQGYARPERLIDLRATDASGRP
jgi:hypothetical protein